MRLLQALGTATLLAVLTACAAPTASDSFDPVVVPLPAPEEPDASAPEPEPEPDPEPDPEPEPEPEPDPEPPPPPSGAPDTWRATWVHLFDDTLKTRAGIAEVVATAVEADVTVIVAQVARRHDAYYTSGHLPRTADPALAPGMDVLAELLDAAHSHGIRVHAWLGLAPTWHAVYEDLPAPDGWVPAVHGQRAPESQRWVSRTHDGAWSEYLDPALPEVQDHLVATVRDLVARYPVDGIHLDYVRYASNREGYHPDALAAYRAASGTSGTPAPDDAAWSAWRRDRTREVIVRVGEVLPSSVQLSAAVITWESGPEARGGFRGTRTYTDALQDWDGWVRDGLVDAVLPMNYFRNHVPEQAAWFGQWLRYEADLAAAAPSVAVVPGIGGWLNAPSAGVDQVRAATRATGHAAIYSYQQPTEDGSRAIWRTLADTHWGAPG